MMVAGTGAILTVRGTTVPTRDVEVDVGHARRRRGEHRRRGWSSSARSSARRCSTRRPLLRPLAWCRAPAWSRLCRRRPVWRRRSLRRLTLRCFVLTLARSLALLLLGSIAIARGLALLLLLLAGLIPHRVAGPGAVRPVGLRRARGALPSRAAGRLGSAAWRRHQVRRRRHRGSAASCRHRTPVPPPAPLHRRRRHCRRPAIGQRSNPRPAQGLPRMPAMYVSCSSPRNRFSPRSPRAVQRGRMAAFRAPFRSCDNM